MAGFQRHVVEMQVITLTEHKISRQIGIASDSLAQSGIREAQAAQLGVDGPGKWSSLIGLVGAAGVKFGVAKAEVRLRKVIHLREQGPSRSLCRVKAGLCRNRAHPRGTTADREGDCPTFGLLQGEVQVQPGNF